ncbi:MAG: thiazole synthase [Acidobacteriaceae bacterium]
MRDQLTLYGETYDSRILLGTARYESPAHLLSAVQAAQPALLTVALRKQMHGGAPSAESFWTLLRSAGKPLLPNTAGCKSAKDAVNTALMAQEVFGTNLIKLEVIGDDVSLQPDPFGLVDAAALLTKRGFRVFPYCTEDLVVCQRLLDAGCEVLMPWAAPIGTGQGPRNPKALRELRERIPDVPLLVDAGLGLPSHACEVMEWGFDGVLLNTAISRAIDPTMMAKAFADAVRAGRGGFLGGPMPVQELAIASTPEVGKLLSLTETQHA